MGEVTEILFFTFTLVLSFKFLALSFSDGSLTLDPETSTITGWVILAISIIGLLGAIVWAMVVSRDPRDAFSRRQNIKYLVMGYLLYGLPTLLAVLVFPDGSTTWWSGLAYLV